MRLVLALTVVLGILIVVAAAGTVVTADDYREAAQRAVQRQGAANQLLVDVLDAETGNRGYSLTGRGDYLQPYLDARRRYPADLARLRALVAGEEDLEALVDSLDQQAQNYFIEARELIRLRLQGRQTEALQRINQNIAKDHIDGFRTRFTVFRGEVEDARRQALADADRRRNLTLLAIVLAALLALIVVLAISRQLWLRVGGPVALLALGVGRVARGRLSDPVPADPGAVREMAQLTRGFNAMQRQVFQQRDAVAAAARGEVAQRTERRLWETVQNGLLPARLPGYPGHRVVARYRPSETALLVGGDFYDAEVLPDGRLAILVGDMAGHGAPAAAQAAGLRFGWRTMVAADPTPARVLSALNAQMYRPELRAEGLFASLVHAIIDPSGRGVFTCAGHPPPVVLGRDGCRELVPAGAAPLLGVMESAEWPENELLLAPGETLVVFTDGLVEAGAPSGDPFGVERVCASLERERTSAVELRVERVIDAARRYDGGRLRDDVVVLAVERVRTPPG